MAKYKLRYGRTVNLGNYETVRIELEEEFDENTEADRFKALLTLAKMVEGYARTRKKYPGLFMPNSELEVKKV